MTYLVVFVIRQSKKYQLIKYVIDDKRKILRADAPIFDMKWDKKIYKTIHQYYSPILKINKDAS